MTSITPCLWFDGNAEEAANHYVALFPDSRVDNVDRSPADYPSGKKGDVITVEFTLDGRPFQGLNGGPHFNFNEAVSFSIYRRGPGRGRSLTAGALRGAGGRAVRLGEGQVRPVLADRAEEAHRPRLCSPDPEGAERAMEAMLQMKRIDMTAIEAAANG